MNDADLRDVILSELNRLEEGERRQVLEFARTLHAVHSRGVSGMVMSKKKYDFDAHGLDEIEKAIEEGCENIDYREW
jgi:hypothetical protein